MIPRIVIFGAGSIGCFLGGNWVRCGFDVRFVGRPSVAAGIARHGLSLTDLDGTRFSLPSTGITFSDAPETVAEADIIVVAVKSTATAEAARMIARHADGPTVVVSMQNGISNLDILREGLPGRTVLRGMVGFNVVNLGGGRLHRGTSGPLIVERHPAMEPLAEATRQTPVPLLLSAEMLAVSWGKLLLNLNNAVNALSGLPLMEELSDRGYRRILAASMREALEILALAGIRPAKVAALPPGLLPGFIGLPDFLFRPIGLRLQKVDASARSSMSDDFVTGKPTEIDFLNGEVVRLAGRMGLDAPVNRKIAGLVRAAEHGGRRNWPAQELQAALGLR